MAEDATNDVNQQSTAGGVTSGSSLNRGLGDPNSSDAPDQYPDTRAVVYDDQPVDTDDNEAIAQALADGRRDLIDVSGMPLAKRMQFGLLTPEDDQARVEGTLGDFMNTSDGAQESNVYRSKAGSDTKPAKASKAASRDTTEK